MERTRLRFPMRSRDIPNFPRPFSNFATFASGEGREGGVRHPWRSAPDGRRASRKISVDASRRDLAIAHIGFVLGQHLT